MQASDLNHTEFIIYCVETYKGRKNIDGYTAYQRLKATGALEYISVNYDALHTFGDDQIVWNIDEFMKSHSGS